MPAVFKSSAPKPFSRLEIDSVKSCWLTQRAADKWESPRFQAVFNASAGFRFRASSASRPLAANASRWAARVEHKAHIIEKRIEL